MSPCRKPSCSRSKSAWTAIGNRTAVPRGRALLGSAQGRARGVGPPMTPARQPYWQSAEADAGAAEELGTQQAMARPTRASFSPVPSPYSMFSSSQGLLQCGILIGFGPLWVIFVRSTRSRRSRHVRFAPIESEPSHRSESTRCARSRPMHRSKTSRGSVTPHLLRTRSYAKWPAGLRSCA